MSFRINTNVNALNTHANAVSNNVDLSKSLNKLSSGLRIQTAADDASGLSIADSLRSQASALGQAIAMVMMLLVSFKLPTKLWTSS